MEQNSKLDSPTPAPSALRADLSFAAEVIEAFLQMGVCPSGYDRDDLRAFANRLETLLAGVVPHRLQQDETKNDDDDQARGGKWGSAQADLPRRNEGDT